MQKMMRMMQGGGMNGLQGLGGMGGMGGMRPGAGLYGSSKHAGSKKQKNPRRKRRNKQRIS